MAIPTYVAAGTYTSGTGALTVPVPAGIQQDDFLLLIVESDAFSSWTTPTGYMDAFTMQDNGTAMYVCWKFATASESSVSVADAGDHTSAQILAYRGVDLNNPINQFNLAYRGSSSTSVSWPAVTTTANDCLIVQAITTDTDIATARISAQANANLSSLTKRQDNSTTQGNGGGIIVLDGGLATAGGTGSTTATAATATRQVLLTMALKGVAITSGLSLDFVGWYNGSTFNDIQLGDTAADRYILVAIICNTANTTCTIGGVSATKHTTVYNSTTGVRWELWGAAVPSGRTGNIVPSGSTHVELVVMRITGADSTTPISQANSVNSTSSVLSDSTMDAGAGDMIGCLFNGITNAQQPSIVTPSGLTNKNTANSTVWYTLAASIFPSGVTNQAISGSASGGWSANIGHMLLFTIKAAAAISGAKTRNFGYIIG